MTRRTVTVAIGGQDTRAGRRYKRMFHEAFEHMERREWAAAAAGFGKVIAQNRQATFHALANRGICYAFLCRPHEALADYERAMKIGTPVERRLIFLNRGVLYGALGRLDEALDDFAMDASREAKFNAALPTLLKGDYRAGLELYRYRQEVAKWRAHPWRLAELEGKTVAILHEQGLGDSVQMARFVPAIAAVAKSVRWVTRAPLTPLLAQIRGVDFEVASEARVPVVAAQHERLLLVMDLMLTAGLDVSFAAVNGKPYLAPEFHRRQRMKALLPEGRKVGLCWRGLADHANDHNRSMPLAALAPLWAAWPDATFVSLQKDLRDDERSSSLFDGGALIGDLADTAALLSRLDVLVTVDTAPLHVAGAIGLKTYALLAHAPDWRWGLSGETTPWYDSVRLVRQSAYGDWNSAVAALVRCGP